MSWQAVSSLNIEFCSVPETIERLKMIQKEYGKLTRIVVDQMHDHTRLIVEAWKPVLTAEEEMAEAKSATLAAYSSK